MTLLWSMINSLQILQLLPLMAINLPSLTLDIFLNLSISQFNFIPFEEIFSSNGVEDNSQSYSEEFETGGVESSNIIFNAPDMIAISVLMFLTQMLFLALNKIGYKYFVM